MECVVVFLKDELNETNLLNKYENCINENDIKIFSYIKQFKKINFYFNFIKNDLDLECGSYFIKRIKKIVKFAEKNNIDFQILVENNNNSFIEKNIIASVEALKIKNKNERINYLYEKICNLLDEQFSENNLCGFENNKCFAKKNTERTMGCCHHYNNKLLGVIWQKELKLCEYQKEKRCTADCITCKMFVCDEIRKKGFYFTVENVLLIKYFFNQVQKLIIRFSFFTEKNKILRRLKIAKI